MDPDSGAQFILRPMRASGKYVVIERRGGDNSTGCLRERLGWAQPLNWGPCGKSLSSSHMDSKGRLSCWQLGRPPPPLWPSAGPPWAGARRRRGGGSPHTLCLSTEAFMWVRFTRCMAEGPVLASTVAEDWSWLGLASLPEQGLMLNSIPPADAEQMMEQIKEVPACPQPESTGGARGGRPGAGGLAQPGGEARGRTWSAWAAALSPTPAGLPHPHYPVLVARPWGRLGMWALPQTVRHSFLGVGGEVSSTSPQFCLV